MRPAWRVANPDSEVDALPGNTGCGEGALSVPDVGGGSGVGQDVRGSDATDRIPWSGSRWTHRRRSPGPLKPSAEVGCGARRRLRAGQPLWMALVSNSLQVAVATAMGFSAPTGCACVYGLDTAC